MSRHWRSLLFLFGRGDFDADLRDEMQRHLEMRAQKLMDERRCTGRCCASRTSGTDPKAWRRRGEGETRRGET